MNEEPKQVKLNFKVDKTSQGNLAQGVEIPEIILEVPAKEDLREYLNSAAICYFKSFPSQFDIILEREPKVIQVAVKK